MYETCSEQKWVYPVLQNSTRYVYNVYKHFAKSIVSSSCTFILLNRAIGKNSQAIVSLFNFTTYVSGRRAFFFFCFYSSSLHLDLTTSRVASYNNFLGVCLVTIPYVILVITLNYGNGVNALQ